MIALRLTPSPLALAALFSAAPARGSSSAPCIPLYPRKPVTVADRTDPAF